MKRKRMFLHNARLTVIVAVIAVLAVTAYAYADDDGWPEDVMSFIAYDIHGQPHIVLHSDGALECLDCCCDDPCAPTGMSVQEPTSTPEATGVPKHTPRPTKEPRDTPPPDPTDEPKPTKEPNPTKEPKPTDGPKPTDPPKPTDVPPTDVPPEPTPKPKCNQGRGNGKEGCSPGNSDHKHPPNDEPPGPGRRP